MGGGDGGGVRFYFFCVYSCSIPFWRMGFRLGLGMERGCRMKKRREVVWATSVWL